MRMLGSQSQLECHDVSMIGSFCDRKRILEKGLSSSTTHRGELVSTGEGHPDLPFGFSDSLMVWGTSLMWKGDRQEEIMGDSGR